MSIKNYDYLVVGQGLAGSILAYDLIKSGASVLVINSLKIPSSSKVAAGIFNPITGKRFVKTWLCDEIFPFLQEYYSTLEKQFNAFFFHKTPIFKPVSSLFEQNFVLGLSERPEISSYANFSVIPAEFKGFIKNNFGGLLIQKSGWVNVPFLLEKFQDYFKSINSFLSEEFNHNDLRVERKIISWKNYTFEKVIFCEGFAVINNPFFNYLPFNAVKGEVLQVQIDDFETDKIYSKNIFLVPLGNKKFKVGATYNWADKTDQKTENGKAEILEKFNKLDIKYTEILEHEAGIRPSTIDRRPFLGLHPEFKNLAIFNGLGTKGVSLTPYLSSIFVDFLKNNKDIHHEININRFSSLYLGFKVN